MSVVVAFSRDFLLTAPIVPSAPGAPIVPSVPIVSNVPIARVVTSVLDARIVPSVQIVPSVPIVPSAPIARVVTSVLDARIAKRSVLNASAAKGVPSAHVVKIVKMASIAKIRKIYKTVNPVLIPITLQNARVCSGARNVSIRTIAIIRRGVAVVAIVICARTVQCAMLQLS